MWNNDDTYCLTAYPAKSRCILKVLDKENGFALSLRDELGLRGGEGVETTGEDRLSVILDCRVSKKAGNLTPSF